MLKGLPIEREGGERAHHFAGGRHQAGADGDLAALEDLRGPEEVFDLAAGARADVDLVDLHLAAGAGRGVIARQVRLGHARHEGGDVVGVGGLDRRIGVAGEHFDLLLAGVFADVGGGLLVGRDDAALAAGLDGHIAEGHPLFHAHCLNRFAAELHRTIGGAIHANVADNAQDDVLGRHEGRQLAVEDKADGRRHADEELAGAHHEAGIGVANAGGEGAQRAVGAGVRVGTEDDLPGADVALLGQTHVADADIGGRARVVEVRKALLLDEGAVDVDIAVGLLVLGVDVVVGHNDHALLREDLGLRPELAVEDADGARTAHVVRQQDVSLRPNIFAGYNFVLTRSPGKDLFSQCHHSCRLTSRYGRAAYARRCPQSQYPRRRHPCSS